MTALVAALVSFTAIGMQSREPDVNAIIQHSVAANDGDWEAAPHFNHFELDRAGDGTRTYEVSMILGSPYYRLVAVNGKPLSPGGQQTERQKLDHAIARRSSETSEERSRRIAQYRRNRKRDHVLMEQLANAFDFKFQGEQQMAGYEVYVLEATPRPDYRPPTLESEVLKGMVGRLWIETKTFQWVKVEARVIRPVLIEGFLARVEAGTYFELENMPVAPGVWLAKHFSMGSRSKILLLFTRRMRQDETYYGYQPAEANAGGPDGSESRAVPAKSMVSRPKPDGAVMRPYV